MSFEFTAEQRAIREAVREFGESEIRPIAKEYNEQERYPEELRHAAAELDLAAPPTP